MRDDDIYEPRLRDLIFWLLFFAAAIVVIGSAADIGLERMERYERAAQEYSHGRFVPEPSP